MTIVGNWAGAILVKIAADLDEAIARRRVRGEPARTMPRAVANGAGWNVADVVCTCGPHERAFEERHANVCIALVVAGAFEYRSSTGQGLLTPGAVMLGNAGQCFECGHTHHTGDRCIAIRYAPEFFERLAADAGLAHGGMAFDVARIGPSRALAPFVAGAATAVAARGALAWDELALALAVRTLSLLRGEQPRDVHFVPAVTLSRVVDLLQSIEAAPDADLSLERLAEQAGLSPYHFLRTFDRATGVTPHQYVLRMRLRIAAQRLADERAKIIDIALACGFGDLSNFNRAFRTEFGMSPRRYRSAHAVR